MTGPRTQYKNTEYAVWHIIMRRGALSSRQIVEIMCDSGCGYFVPPSQTLGSKMRVWGYQQQGKAGPWVFGSRVRQPERPATMPRKFDSYIDEKWPLNK